MGSTPTGGAMIGGEPGSGGVSVSTVPGAATSGLPGFERCLVARGKVPAGRLGEYLNWTNEQIRDEIQGVSESLREFAAAVIRSMEAPHSVQEFLGDLDLRRIVVDHDWRALFAVLRRQAAERFPFKQAALVRYLQYLSFRKRLLEYIYTRKVGLDETDAYTPAQVDGELTVEAPRPAAATGARTEGWMRLPLGESVELRLDARRSVAMRMAGHQFRLGLGDPPRLVDENGVVYFIRAGRNMVGRHPESDIVVDPGFRDISRAHLIIDWRPTELLSVMDFSSRGTYLLAGDLLRLPPGL